MDPKFELTQKEKQALTQKQAQRLMMSARMQQGIYFLQLPILELEATIEQELDQNPLLEILEPEEEEERDEEQELDQDCDLLAKLQEDNLNQESFRKEKDADLQTFLESLIQKRETLFENLMKQACEAFTKKEEIETATGIIGSLDERGFLTTPLDEIAFLTKTEEPFVKEILSKIQEFDPPGIAAESLQQCLLIQLRRNGLEKSLAYRLVDEHLEDLIQNKISLIENKLHESRENINKAVKEHIAPLDLKPGNQFSENVPNEIVPDLSIVEEEGVLVVKVGVDRLPELKINRNYVAMFKDKSLSKEEREFLRSKMESAKWLLKNIFQRQSTLERIGNWLLEKQRPFFTESTGQLLPAFMRELAEELGLHESTIVRAISNKYLYCERGMLPLRTFFTAAYTGASGEQISAKTVKDTVKEMIAKENKKHPLSDKDLETELEKLGIPVARRTIAKYRNELNIGNAHQRRKYL